MAPTLDPLAEYVRIWLSRAGNILMPTFPAWLRLGPEFFAEREAGRPGFTEHLRAAARDDLASLDGETARKGVRVLAILGTQEDIGALTRLRDAREGLVATDARSAVFEIKHRTRAI